MSAKPKNRALQILKPLIAIGVLAIVFRMLPWTDVLTYTPVTGTAPEALEVSGEILGDWKASTVEFSALDADDEVTATWRLVRGEVAADAPEDAEPPPSEVFTLAGERVGTDAKWDPGMVTVFRSVELSWVALAMALFFVALLFGVTRWWRLLRLVGCESSWYNVMRLTYLGLFFNLVMPGLTGGDVAKAVLVVRENPERRAWALMSVIVDRVIGLATLALLALVVVLLSGDTFAELRLPMLAGFVVGVGGAFAYFNRGLRRALRFDRIIAKLPMADKLRNLDEAARHYFEHPVELAMAVVYSLGNHTGAIVAVWALGNSFGVTAEAVGLFDYFALVPIANIVSSVPVMPGGWGVGEAVYIYLFTLIGASASLGVAVSVSFRLCQLLLSLLGGMFLLAPGARAELDDLEELDLEAEAPPPQ